VFDLGAAGTLTAGNSTPLTDGASAVLLASEEWAREHALPVLAYLSYGKAWAVDFASGAEGLLMAPAYAVAAMLKDAGLGLADFDYYELHEAFAAQVLATLAAWESAQYCRDALNFRRPWRHQPGTAQCEGRQRRPGTSFCCNRHPHCREPCQNIGGRSQRQARPGIRLYGRWHGSHCNSRARVIYDAYLLPRGRTIHRWHLNKNCVKNIAMPWRSWRRTKRNPASSKASSDF